MTTEQIEFGSQLRRERERRQVTLSEVAESTKINKSLLASLERGDAAHWPKGIYRRAFLREYATAVGLPSETMIAEFQRLFPESGSGAFAGPVHPGHENTLRLTLAPERTWPARSFALQVAAAIFDGAAVLATSAAIATLLHLNIGTIAAILALSYYSIATAAVGSSPALSIMNAIFLHGSNGSQIRNQRRSTSRELLHIVSITPRPEMQTPQHDQAASTFVAKVRSAS